MTKFLFFKVNIINDKLKITFLPVPCAFAQKDRSE